MAEYKLNYTGNQVDAILQSAEEDIPSIKNAAFSSIEKTTKTTGQVVLTFESINGSKSKAITLPLDQMYLGQAIETKVAVGNIPAGTTIGADKSLQSIILEIFGCSGDIHVTGVSLDRAELTISVGNTAKLTATITPENATNKNVTWTSSDTEVATITENELEATITALKEGTATITVTTEDGGKTATCSITGVILVSGITLDSSEVSIYEGATDTVTVSIDPETATNTEIKVTSSNSTVATAEETFANSKKRFVTITGKKKGNAIITITAQDGSGKSATCNANITEAPISTFTLYYGATDEIPTSISELTNTALLQDISEQTYVQTIISGHGSGKYAVGQYPVFAVPTDYTITKWVVTDASSIELDIAKVTADNYNLYHITNKVDDHDEDPAGTNYTITIKKGV